MYKDVLPSFSSIALDAEQIRQPLVAPLVRSTYALILAGGRGTRLKQLTEWRAKPAVPFGGKHRIVDFALSNCVNSGVRRIGVVTQYKAHSLIQHVRRGWSFLDPGLQEFIDVLPAQQRLQDSWYQGTADAVYQNLDIINMSSPAFILVLAGDHVYKMDYGVMLAEHVSARADVTVACIEVPRNEGKAFGIVQIDPDKRVIAFREKPADPDPIPGQPERSLASMGVYVFNATFLYQRLRDDARLADSGHDFGHDILPNLIGTADVRAHLFNNSCVNMADGQPYWRDVGTLDAYWEANIDLTRITPQLNLYDKRWPIRTFQEQLPAAKFVFDDDQTRGHAMDSLVSNGSIVSGATVRRSLLSTNVVVEKYSLIEDSVVLPDVEIGQHVTLRHVIVDKFCRIPDGFAAGVDPESDRRRFEVTERGTILITPEMLGQHVHSLDFH
jgi:glucose-1-phosphate adenylyltransferase